MYAFSINARLLSALGAGTGMANDEIDSEPIKTSIADVLKLNNISKDEETRSWKASAKFQE